MLTQECPERVCKLGKWPSGSTCSTCVGKGTVPTLLGIEIKLLIEQIITERYGKSSVASTACVSKNDQAEARKTDTETISKNGSSTPALPRPPAHLSAGASTVRQLPPASQRRSSQAGPWTLP